MSQPSSPPPLSQYPGYFPAAKPPFWSRSKVGLAAGVLGLLVGVGVGAADAQEPAAPRASLPTSQVQPDDAVDVQAEVDDAVDAVTDEMKSKLERQKTAAAARLTRAGTQAKVAQQRAVRQAVTSAVAKVRAEEQAKTAAAVDAALSAAQPAQVQPLASNSGGTDPRFSYCYEVVAAGYGPYYQGQDPEYDWYDDADNDGSVCE